jgi:hypothetical protein
MVGILTVIFSIYAKPHLFLVGHIPPHSLWAVAELLLQQQIQLRKRASQAGPWLDMVFSISSPILLFCLSV